MKTWLRNLPSTDSLGFRLSLTLVLALMPLGILSVIQTKSAQDQIDQATLDAVGAAAMSAVAPQIEMIRSAQTAARILAGTLALGIPPDDDCIALVRSVKRAIPQASAVAYIPLSGRMTCSSTGTPHDFANDPIFARLKAKPEPALIYNPMGPLSGVPVIGASQPVFDTTGTRLGIVSVSVPHALITPKIYARDYALWRPALIVAFTGDGTVLTSSIPKPDLRAWMPPGLELNNMSTMAGRSLFLIGQDGRTGVVSVTKVAADFFLLSTWRRDLSAWGGMGPYLLPALTWAAALVAAAWSSSQLIVRHIRSLSRSMTAFSMSRTRSTLTDIGEAPIEIRTLHTVYEEMIRTIEQEQAELENLLLDKETLLKEVHHRSGNSLQLIASTMSLYRRETSDPALRGVLDGLINRIIALASTHISLFNLFDREDVPIDEVLAAVIRRLKEIHGIAIGTVRKHFAPVRMPSKASIPFALALAEIMSCHFAAKIDADNGIDVTLSETDESVRLCVVGPKVPELLPEAASGFAALPRRMLAQFAEQLHAELSMQSDGGRSVVTLTIPRVMS